METYPQRVFGELRQVPWWEEPDLEYLCGVVRAYYDDANRGDAYCQTWLIEQAAERLFNRLGDRIDALRRAESEIPF